MAADISATDTELTLPVNVIFQTNFLAVARANCPYFNGTMPGDLVQHGGSFTANWRRVENLTPTTTPLTELNTTASAFARSSDTASVTDVTKAVSKYGQYVILSEEADLGNPSGQVAQIGNRLAIVAGRSMNMVQRDEMEDNSGITYTDGVASDGVVDSKITLTAVETVVNSLVRNDAMPFSGLTPGSTNIGTVPTLQAFWGICHPDVAYDIAKFSTGFTSVEKYANQVTVMPGEFGLVSIAGYSVRFVQTSDASIDSNSGSGTASSLGLRTAGNTGIDLYTTVIYGEEACGSLGFGIEHVKEIYRAGDKLPTVQMISHGRGSAGAADPLNEIMTMGYKAWAGPKVLQTNWIQGIRSGATSLVG